MKSEIKNAENYLYEYDRILQEVSNKAFRGRISNNVTADFVYFMIPYYKVGIDVCEEFLKYTDNYPLGQFAYTLINEKKEAIRELKGIRKSIRFNDLQYNVNVHVNDNVSIMHRTIYEMSASLRSIDINRNFVSEMAPYLAGAVRMCQNVLQYDIDEKLKYLVINMMEISNNEIKNLEAIVDSL